MERRRQPEGREDAAEEAVATGHDAELEIMRTRYRAEFSQAFQEAFGALSSEQRNLLRLHLLKGLGVEKLALLFRVNPSTISRRLPSSGMTRRSA